MVFFIISLFRCIGWCIAIALVTAERLVICVCVLCSDLVHQRGLYISIGSRAFCANALDTHKHTLQYYYTQRCNVHGGHFDLTFYILINALIILHNCPNRSWNIRIAFRLRQLAAAAAAAVIHA